MMTKTERRPRRVFVLLPGLILLAGLTGCADPADRYVTPQRLDRGMVYILPGIEGESQNNLNIRDGLIEAGTPYAVEIYKWGFPVPGLGLLVNQTNTPGNRKAAKRLANTVVEYETEYPGRPVYLIGHSGGGGVAVFTLEALADMPNAKPVEGAFLVSSSISADYDLTKALTMTRRGIANFSNPDDTALLGVGTAVFGNVDGGHGDSAGRTGFTRPYDRVFERHVTGSELGLTGDPHTVLTNAELVSRSAPRWFNTNPWPPPLQVEYPR